jgi:hypothetical protein
MTTNIWPAAPAPHHSITSCRDEVVACAVGHTFGIVAIATCDGSISMIAIATGATARVITIQETPVLILVTAGWGFVLVQSVGIVDAIPHYFLSHL